MRYKKMTNLIQNSSDLVKITEHNDECFFEKPFKLKMNDIKSYIMGVQYIV